jgi:HSP20 family protein
VANVSRPLPPALKDIGQLRREFDEVFERLLGRQPAAAPAHAAMPSIESFLDKDSLVVRADLPGIDPKDVEVSVIGNSLVIRGKRESSKQQSGRDYYHREISYGSFERSIVLPEGVKADQIKASYKNGVLELNAPLAKPAPARKVPIAIESEPAGSKKS